MNTLLNATASTVILLGLATPAQADLFGTQVEGSLVFGSGPNEFTTAPPVFTFPDANGGFLAVAGNASGNTVVTIADTAPYASADVKGGGGTIDLPFAEFAFTGPLFTLGLNFTANGLDFGLSSFAGSEEDPPLEAMTITLTAQTPGAFQGMTLGSESAFTSFLSWSLNGDTITITAPAGPSADALRTASFSFTGNNTVDTPEPATIALFTTGLLGLAAAHRRRQPARTTPPARPSP